MPLQGCVRTTIAGIGAAEEICSATLREWCPSGATFRAQVQVTWPRVPAVHLPTVTLATTRTLKYQSASAE